VFKKVKIDYNFDKVLSSDYSSDSEFLLPYCQKHIPEFYNTVESEIYFSSKNSTFHQIIWNKEQLDYEDIGKQLEMKVVDIRSTRQNPGNCVPYHRDIMGRIKRAYPNISTHKIIRANIFLEDYKLGHFLQVTVDNKHYTVPPWSCNEGYIWDDSIYHLSCNAGLAPKYTLQVTGLLID